MSFYTLEQLKDRPLLATAIYNGVVRRTRASQQAADLQVQAGSANLRARFDSGDEDLDAGFAALRQLSALLVVLRVLEDDGAFEPLRRTSPVRFVVGQRLRHAELGPCVPYGWDPTCRAIEPPDALAMERAAVEGVAVDNRRAFYKIDRAGLGEGCG